jgi:hypothetical protein
VIGTHFRYPFGHSTLLVPSYALFGATWTTAVGVNAALFAVFLLLLFLSAKVSATVTPDPGASGSPTPAAFAAGLGAGVLAALLALNSPLLVRQGLTMMLEMPALVLGTALLWLYARALDRPEETRPLSWAGWTLTGLVVTASQYASVWLFIVGTFEVYRARPEDRRVFLGWLQRVVTSRAMLHPLVLISLALVAAAVVIFFTGGGVIQTGGLTLSLVHPGTPLTLGLLAAVAQASWLTYVHRAELRKVVPQRYQVLFASVVVPIVAWFFVLYPFRLTHFLNWTTQSAQPLPRSSLAFWTFYPKELFAEGGSFPIIPIGVLLVCLLGFAERGVSDKIRFLRWALVWSSAIVILHSARQGRFIIPFLPVWIVLGSATLARALARIPSPRLQRAAAPTMLALALVVLGGTAVGLFRKGLAPLAESAFTPASLGYREVLLKVTGEAVRKPSVRVLGSFAGLSHHLFEWELRRSSDFQDRELAFDLGESSKSAGKEHKDARDAFDRWLEAAPEELVYALEPIDLSESLPEAAGSGAGLLTREAALVMRRMRDTPRYTRSGEWVFPSARLRVVEYSLVGDRPQIRKKSKHRADR